MPKKADKAAAPAMLRITLIKSLNRRLQAHKDCVRGLGLRRIRHSVDRPATPENLGMVNKVRYLLTVEELSA